MSPQGRLLRIYLRILWMDWVYLVAGIFYWRIPNRSIPLLQWSVSAAVSKQLVLPRPAKQDPGNTLKDCNLRSPTSANFSKSCRYHRDTEISHSSHARFNLQGQLHKPVYSHAWSPQPYSSWWPQSSNKDSAQRQGSKICHQTCSPSSLWVSAQKQLQTSALQGRHHGLFPSMVQSYHDPAGESHETSTTRHSAEQITAVLDQASTVANFPDGLRFNRRHCSC